MARYYKVTLSILFTAVLVSSGWSQDRALQQLIHGKKYFWEAKFDQAIAALNNVIEADDVSKDNLFEAYLYHGFVLLRRNAPPSDAYAYFEKAIRLYPQRRIDDPVIPPDLIESFEQVRERLMGCYYVITEPPEADLMVIDGDSVRSSHKTPVEICDLADTDYQLLLKKPGYESQFVPLNLRAGQTDTVNVALSTTTAKTVPSQGSRFWPWLVRGGVVAGAAAVLYLTVLDEGVGTETGEQLPGPPPRPDVGSN